MIGGSTLHDFARNPDGNSYDGRKVIQWLFEATTGMEMSDAEAQEIVDRAQEQAREKAACRK